MKTYSIELNSLHYQKVDDFGPFNDDEPYVIGVQFKAHMLPHTSGNTTVYSPDLSTLEVGLVGFANQHDLGHSGSGWAKAGGRYKITGQSMETTLNVNDPGWISGELVCFFEQDEWGSKEVVQAQKLIQTEVKKSLSTMNVSGLGVNYSALMDKVSSNVGSAFHSLSFKNIYHSLLSALNPDDFGGVDLVVLTTGQNGEVRYFAGDPGLLKSSQNQMKLLRAGQGGQMSQAFSLYFLPQTQVAAIVQMDPAARYGGMCTFGGNITLK